MWEKIWNLACSCFLISRRIPFSERREQAEQCCNNDAKLCCAKNRRCESSRVTSLCTCITLFCTFLYRHVTARLRSEKRRLWNPKQWRLHCVLLAKVVLSRYFWPTSWILLKQLFLSPSWPLRRRMSNIITQNTIRENARSYHWWWTSVINSTKLYTIVSGLCCLFTVVATWLQLFLWVLL